MPLGHDVKARHHEASVQSQTPKAWSGTVQWMTLGVPLTSHGSFCMARLANPPADSSSPEVFGSLHLASCTLDTSFCCVSFQQSVSTSSFVEGRFCKVPGDVTLDPLEHVNHRRSSAAHCFRCFFNALSSCLSISAFLSLAKSSAGFFNPELSGSLCFEHCSAKTLFCCVGFWQPASASSFATSEGVL